MTKPGRRARKSELEPRAYLRTILNVLPGIISRTKVIRTLKDDWKSISKISMEAGLSYKVVYYHLHLMEKEKIVTFRSRRPKVWHLTGLGQQRIITQNS